MTLIAPTSPGPIPAMDAAHQILLGAHQSCESFHASFLSAGAPQAPSDHDQDLLRATLVFASSGLDAMAKQLVLDVLPLLVPRDHEIREQVRTYAERQLKSQDSSKILSNVLTADDPRAVIVDSLVKDLRSGSLQSVDELSRVASFFAIPAVDAMGEIDALREAFRTRNQISHEMDVDFSRAPSIRRQRDPDDLVGFTNTVLKSSNRFFDQVGARAEALRREKSGS